jgi:hypothetical protein
MLVAPYIFEYTAGTVAVAVPLPVSVVDFLHPKNRQTKIVKPVKAMLPFIFIRFF